MKAAEKIKYGRNATFHTCYRDHRRLFLATSRVCTDWFCWAAQWQRPVSGCDPRKPNCCDDDVLSNEPGQIYYTSVSRKKYVSKQTSKNIYTGFPLSRLQKFPGIFQDFPEPQKYFSGTLSYTSDVYCLNIKINSSYYGVRDRAPASSNFSCIQIKSGANFRKFWHLHLHHCVCLPHHSL